MPALNDSFAVMEKFSVESRVLLWIAWSRVAIRQEALASGARKCAEELHGKNENISGALDQEFEASVVVVTAVANALEALYGGLLSRAPTLTKSDNYRPDWKKVWLSLDACFALTAHEQAATWPDRFEHLFAIRRNAVVHFKEPTQPLGEHPMGFKTSPEYCDYTKEEAALNVDLLLGVLTACGRYPTRSSNLKLYQDEIRINAIAFLDLRRKLTT